MGHDFKPAYLGGLPVRLVAIALQETQKADAIAQGHKQRSSLKQQISDVKKAQWRLSMNHLIRLLDLFRPIIPVIQQPGKPGSYPVNTRLRKKR